jgi:23S rRNA (adenine2503-C2)-methyltransferase
MPRSVRYPLREIQARCSPTGSARNLALGVHWCLLPGINDTQGRCRSSPLLRAAGRTFVHVIPYNPGSRRSRRHRPKPRSRRSSANCAKHGLAVRRRITKGRSVMAACGQLRPRRRQG